MTARTREMLLLAFALVAAVGALSVAFVLAAWWTA